jgi:FAD-NAD(P)-binding
MVGGGAVRIAVIGVGPRGLSVLERVVSHARTSGPPIELLLIEPGELGVGIHSASQPDFLLLNTIASQLTIFSDEQMTPGKPVTAGPSLFEWCRLRNAAVRFDDFLPRRLLGEYLTWAAGVLLAEAPDRLTVHRLRTYATDVRQAGGRAVVTLADGREEVADLAVVTTGHGLASAARMRLNGAAGIPYPLPHVADIRAGQTVAVLGSGLTAMDVVAMLTVGRGGRFRQGRYLPSGNEPRIVLTNRSGQLPCARPATRADRRPAPARYFTPEAVHALRAQAPDGRLDFRSQVEPLIVREVYTRMAGASPAERAMVAEVLQPAGRRWQSYQDFCDHQLDRARADLVEAERGLGDSLVKEGLECLRDHRRALCAALDPPGLTAESHEYFMKVYVPLVNRAVIGPQKERIREVLALRQAGIVSLGPGPRPLLTPESSGWRLRSTGLEEPSEQAVDVVINANLSWPVIDPDLDPISNALRRWVAPGPGGARCLGLDRYGYAIAQRQGGERRTVAVFGPPAEGASYYNHYVPSPGVWSRILTDLDQVLEPVLADSERTAGSSVRLVSQPAIESGLLIEPVTASSGRSP